MTDRTSYTKAYREQHPKWWSAAVTAFNANALARRYGSPDRITTQDVLALWERQPTCADCGTGRGLDHIVSVRLGGLNHPSNLRTLCRFCNARRGGINSGIERRRKREATAVLPTDDPNKELTLSEAGEPLLEADRSAAARLEDLLELQHRARVLGLRDLSEVYADRIVDELDGAA